MNARLDQVLATHLHPIGGSPYWLERERALGFRLRSRITCLADLDLLGPFDLAALATRPLADFMPRSLDRSQGLVLGETGGTTGVPSTTVYTVAEFHDAFVEPFFACVDGARVFNGGHWLWLGPGGPHIIGKAAQRIAQLSTGCDAFAIDFDPRWYRRLAPASLARSRYLEHLLEQALRIVVQQDVRYLFTTPVVLDTLAQRMSATVREAVRLVYLGRMAIDDAMLQHLAALLPAADFLCGYGNTLFGVCHEARAARPMPGARCYFPSAPRIVVRITSDTHGSTTCRYGERGQVVMYRLDESCFLPLVRERDHAVRIANTAGDGADGLSDPRPPALSAVHIDHGIY